MAADPLRVALLARPGVARERLRGVLDESGANRVLEADPTELTLPVLVEAAPQAVLVALDAVTEDVLDRFDDVLFDPSVDVIYEEADLAASREGWDVARWQRHLVAKLQRHSDVLPPGREPDEDAGAGEAGGEPPMGFTTEAAVAGDQPAGSPALAPDVIEEPAAAGGVAGLTAGTESVEAPASTEPMITLEASFEPVAAESNPFDPVLAEIDSGTSDASDTFLIDFDPDFGAGADAGRGADIAEHDGAVGSHTETAPGHDVPDLDFAFDLHPIHADAAVPEFGVDLPDPAQPGQQAGSKSPMEPPGIDAMATDAPEPEPAPASGFGTLTLDDGTGPIVDNSDARHRFQHDLSDLEQRIAGLELVDDSPVRGPEQASGAVVVLAGIGGPDAVRQLLGALPPDFPRPILIQQRLDGARYDKLVAQMQRATTLPVQLAAPDAVAHAGFVYILPADIGLTVGDQLRFDQSGDLLSRLPSGDSAVLLLSGSDPAHLDAVMNHSWAGALVAGQAADGCYDAAASHALVARGGDTAPPAELARRLAERWA